MLKWTVGILATCVLLTGATSTAAQSRANVSSSESSRQTEPTCVINGETASCGGSGVLSTPPLIFNPVIVGLGPVGGGGSEGRTTTDTSVQRSSRNGSAVAR